MGWKRNPWTHLYEWVRFMSQEGFDEARMLKAFEINDATKMDPSKPEDVALAKVIIKDALGEVVNKNWPQF